MQIHHSHAPAQEAAHQINKHIEDAGDDTLCLLSGGSSLSVIEHIKRPSHECRTIFCMGDERGSRESEINNSLQAKSLYPQSFVTENLLMTVPKEKESLKDFTNRISLQLTDEIRLLNNPTIIYILGIGEDGHTAGIFPLEEKAFQEIYRDDQTYVPVHLDGLTIDLRASLTPEWILNNVDHGIGYAVGKSKRMILESLKNETKTIHERPAEILKLHSDINVYTDT